MKKCPITTEEAFGQPHVCIWPACKLNTATAIYNKAVEKFDKQSMKTTMRGFLQSAKQVEETGGDWDLFPDIKNFCRCNECCRTVVLGSAQVSGILHFMSAIQEILSRNK